MEDDLARAVQQCGYRLRRAHSVKRSEGHGFIASQKEGMQVFSRIPRQARLIVAEAVWQYSHHILGGLVTHQGPVLTVANWSGTWPGLVGMLNLNGSLTKAGVRYSTLWGEDFSSADFRRKLGRWLAKGSLRHDTRHVAALDKVTVGDAERRLGEALADQLQREKAIMGVFDEGCMGMFNAIIPDHLLHPTGVYKERLSQSALYFETTQVRDDEALEVRNWLEKRGLQFRTGTHHATDLTDDQILLQCKMYIAAVRLADDFGCATIGIQYQQGLKDLLPASDLVEGTLNNGDRPPVRSRDGKRTLYRGRPLPHFNEVDECAGLDGLMTYRVHQAMRQPVENTLHDLRWGDWDPTGTTDDYVWVLLISGSRARARIQRSGARARNCVSQHAASSRRSGPFAGRTAAPVPPGATPTRIRARLRARIRARARMEAGAFFTDHPGRLGRWHPSLPDPISNRRSQRTRRKMCSATSGKETRKKKEERRKMCGATSGKVTRGQGVS
jgi:hypothetical protein